MMDITRSSMLGLQQRVQRACQLDSKDDLDKPLRTRIAPLTGVCLDLVGEGVVVEAHG